ncbi:MAG: Swt1 family HEPN domain-containing protein [Gemmatimonadaceae bacterium]
MPYVLDVRGPGRIPDGGSRYSTNTTRASRGVPVQDADIAALLGIMLDKWALFGEKLSPLVRSYIRELKDIRNQWAHERPFTEEEGIRALDTIRLVGQAIGRPRTLSSVKQAQNVPVVEKKISSPLRMVSHARDSSDVRRDGSGVILNANELNAVDVVNHRVLCPACGKKIFERWPSGWDAHSGTKCNADLGASPEARKSAFKERYRFLFR